MPRPRRTLRKRRAAPSDRASLDESVNALPFSFMELGDRQRELGEKQMHLLSFCYRWLPPRARRYLIAVLEECTVLPHWEHSELLREKLSVREIPSRKGSTPKEVATPGIALAHDLLKNLYERSGQNVREVGRALEALRHEEVARRVQALLNAGGPKEYQALLKMDLLLKGITQDLEKRHPSPSDFAEIGRASCRERVFGLV